MPSLTKSLVGLVDTLCPAVVFLLLGSRKFGIFSRTRILLRILRARAGNRGRSASGMGEQLTLVSAILNIPDGVPGAIAEFGCYKGLSTVALSIAARYAGRRLIVFDSFEGLPEPAEAVHGVASGRTVDYRKGAFSGTLDEVRSVVAKYGELEQVEFVRGYFCDTLPARPSDERYVLMFEDADLVESVRDVLKHAWPKLQPGCRFYSHEALDLEVAKLFFNDSLWHELHGCKAPGLVGVGLGLPLGLGRWRDPGLKGVLGSGMGGVIKS